MEQIIRDITPHIHFRLVDTNDTEFILSLRTDPQKSRFISHVRNDLDAQIRWINDYKEREKQGTEYYFIIEDTHAEKIGTIRLYDFRGDSFCWGSWILKDDAPAYAAIESVLFVYEIGLYRLGFMQSHTDVRKDNHTVVTFLKNFGAVITHEDELNYYFRMTRDIYETTKARYRRFLKSPMVPAGTPA